MRAARLSSARATSVTALAAIALVVVSAGCGVMRLTPPSPAGASTDVVITDYGLHAGLVLPRTPTQDEPAPMGEYAFGEWEWFALGRDGWHRVPAALFVSSDGALKRRPIDAIDPASAHLSTHAGVERTITLRVERGAALALSARLDARIDASPELVSHHDTTFARVEEQYDWTNNCNHVLARWLEELGVMVSGSRAHARFVVVAPVGP